ncbi:MAG: hypothetical protein AAF959_24830, partial [Cyanobacteria bacterium P01_D01_bin.56]
VRSRLLSVGSSLSSKNKNSYRKDYREYYTSKTRKIVEEVYRQDIELLGYDFNNVLITDTADEERIRNYDHRRL